MQSLITHIPFIINIIGLVQAVTLSCILFSKGNQNQLNYYIASMLLVLAIIIGNTLIILSDLSNFSPFWQALSNGVVLLIGPSILAITVKGLGKEIKRSTFFYHLIPFILYIPFSFIPLILNREPAWHYYLEIFFIFWVWNVQIFAYQIYALKKINSVSAHYRKDFIWIRNFIIGFLTITSINFCLVITARWIHPIPEEITLNITVLLSFVVVSIVYKSQSSPVSVFRPLAIEKVAEKELFDWEKKLGNLLINDKIYRLNKLSLSSLSEKVGVNQRTLSEMINHRYGKNFNEFINEYRVKELIEKIENNEHESTTIIGLAETVGFKSNSAFYRAFKNYTGTTPKDFISKVNYKLVTNHYS